MHTEGLSTPTHVGWLDGWDSPQETSACRSIARSSVTVGPSSLLGGPGDDKLTFLVHNPGPALSLNLSLDGDGGFNTAVRTTNVAAFNVQSDTVVP